MATALAFDAQSAAVPFRGVHLDLKGLVPTFHRLLELVDIFYTLRIQAILVEWEDCFPWSCDPRLRAPHAYTKDQILQFAKRCDELGIEIIPLVQSLGHSENVLRLPGNESMREVPHRTDVFHPLAQGSPQIVADMIRDVIELIPGIKHFHLGGDEVYTLGKHPASKEFIETYGIAELYLKQLQPSLILLKDNSIRPLLWHDEVVQWEDDQIKVFAQDFDLVVWGYTGDPRNPETYHFRLPHIEKLHKLGCSIWGATSYKGADGPWANLPDTLARAKATQGWAALTAQFGLKGIFITAWSRYASGRIQVTPIDGALDSLAYMAITLHNGQAPLDGIKTCISVLDDLGEATHLASCKQLLCNFTTHVDRSWDWIRQLHEQKENIKLEPTRANSGIEEIIFDLLAQDITACREFGEQLEQCLNGKVVAPLPQYYWESRLRAIEDASNQLVNDEALCASSAALA
ncbi:family 20 glycosylhydrolase [Cerasicoccus maritimus]|uniref:family 20 glycosylhydrolase n=1 Tax=Cerasicoccus maritimus TaxID=490089 RepID=UPI0028527963|nr:family 20 glycosylhydrolase [Cerasicoccus maritimus]